MTYSKSTLSLVIAIIFSGCSVGSPANKTAGKNTDHSMQNAFSVGTQTAVEDFKREGIKIEYSWVEWVLKSQPLKSLVTHLCGVIVLAPLKAPIRSLS